MANAVDLPVRADEEPVIVAWWLRPQFPTTSKLFLGALPDVRVPRIYLRLILGGGHFRHDTLPKGSMMKRTPTTIRMISEQVPKTMAPLPVTNGGAVSVGGSTSTGDSS